MQIALERRSLLLVHFLFCGDYRLRDDLAERKDLASQREIQKQASAQEEKFKIEQERNFRIAKDALKLTLRKFTKMSRNHGHISQ